MAEKPYIKPIRGRLGNTWSWTWRCPRTDHPSYAWCGGEWDTWRDCASELARHWRTYHA